jgi:pseudouridine synthase
MSSTSSVRLNKLISDSGYCSRREADKLIDSNRVKVNGRRPELGTRIEAGDVVEVDGQEIQGSDQSKLDRVYIAYNKPIGITCTTEHSVKGNIVDAIDHDERIFPIGRLDKPSEGLILLTSDGDIVNRILRAENAHEKEYLVAVNKSIGPGFVEKMSRGVPILDTVTKPCKVTTVGRSAFKITLTQGLNRQIRRMCEYLGYEVTQLVRLRIMSVELRKLKPGQWRNLTRQEMEQINASIAGSKSESGGRKSSAPTKKGKPGSKARTANARTPQAKKPGSKSRKSAGQPARGGEGKTGNRNSSKKPGRPSSRRSPTASKRRK